MNVFSGEAGQDLKSAEFNPKKNVEVKLGFLGTETQSWPKSLIVLADSTSDKKSLLCEHFKS